MLRRNKNSGQTILELFFVLMALTFFFALSFFVFNLYDISQKQVMLTRTQAFIELGNFSDFGGTEHGKDDSSSAESQVVFHMGENATATRVDIESVQSFKDSVNGELNILGSRAENEDAGWNQFRFPRNKTTISTGARLTDRGDGGGGENLEFELSTYLAIAHSRNIDLSRDGDNGRDVKDAMFSGSIFFDDQFINQLANAEPGTGEGLVDNIDTLKFALRELSKEDASLSDEAEQLQNELSVNASTVYGGQEAAIVMSFISMAGTAFVNNAQILEQAGGLAELSQNLNNVSLGLQAAGSVAAATGNASAVNGLMGAAGAVGALGGVTGSLNNLQFRPNDFLYNFGVANNFASQVFRTADAGFRLAGKEIEGLGIAASITGVAGGFSSGISQLQNASQNSEIFGAISNISGATSSAFSLAGQDDLAKGFGIAAAGFGLAGSVALYDESNRGLNNGWKEVKLDAEGNPVLDSDGKLQYEWRGDKKWLQTQSVGGIIQQAGGLISSVDEGSKFGAGLGAIGGAVGTVGMVGGFQYDVKNGKYDGKFFEGVRTVGSVVAAASASGQQLATATGNKKMAETFAYGSLVGGAIGLVGIAGQVGQGIAEDIKKRNEEKATLKQLNEAGPLTEEQYAQKRALELKYDSKIRAEAKKELKALEKNIKSDSSDIESIRQAVDLRKELYPTKNELPEYALSLQQAEAANPGVELTPEALKEFQQDVADNKIEPASWDKIADNFSAVLSNMQSNKSLLIEAKGQEWYDQSESQLKAQIHEAKGMAQIEVPNLLLRKGQDALAIANVAIPFARFAQAFSGGTASVASSAGPDNLASVLAQSLDQTPQQVIQSTITQYHDLDLSLQQQLSASEYRELKPNIRKVQAMLLEQLKPVDQQDPSVIDDGYWALLELEAAGWELQGAPKPNTPERRLFDQKRINNQTVVLRSSRDYLSKLQYESVQTVSFVKLSEEKIEGRRLVVSDASSRNQIRKTGQEISKIIQNQMKYYPEGHPFRSRLERADLAYRRPEFISSREVLGEIRSALKMKKKVYRQVQTAFTEYGKAMH